MGGFDKFGDESFIKSGEELRQEAIERDRLDSAPVLADLTAVGFEVEHITHLYIRKLSYKAAIPILIKWLPIVTNEHVKEFIVRALSVPWAKPVACIPLISEFRRLPTKTRLSVRWAIGNALEAVADDSVFEELSELARDKQYGRDREMVVLALGKMKNPKSVDVLVELLDDDDVAGHAVAALRKLCIEATRPHLERFVDHPKTWVRNEAKKALAKLDKRRQHSPG
jgi:hypothetical protein